MEFDLYITARDAHELDIVEENSLGEEWEDWDEYLD